MVGVGQEREYIESLIRRVGKENPCIVGFIADMAKRSNDPKTVVETAILVYRLLEKQEEIDNEPSPLDADTLF